MKFLNFFYSIFLYLEKSIHIPLLLSRFTIAVVFIVSGSGKLKHIDKVTEYFISLGIPFPHFFTPFTACVELCSGVLILIGLGTRFFSFVLIIILTVAILTARLQEITGLYSLFEQIEFTYIVILVWLLFKGSGQYSLDKYIKKIYFNPS